MYKYTTVEVRIYFVEKFNLDVTKCGVLLFYCFTQSNQYNMNTNSIDGTNIIWYQLTYV